MEGQRRLARAAYINSAMRSHAQSIIQSGFAAKNTSLVWRRK
jgi:hypothetical protein